MKRILILIVCMMMLAAVPAMAEATPISEADIQQVSSTGYTTMADYIDALKPTGFTWYFEGEATGTTEFQLEVPGGTVSLRVYDATDYQDDDAGLEGATQLAGAVLTLPARLIGATWESAELSQVKLPRGLKLGDTEEALTAAISGLEFVEMEADESEEGYTKAASCELQIPEDEDAWHEYYGFDFFLKDGKIMMAQMWYGTDDE